MFRYIVIHCLIFLVLLSKVNAQFEVGTLWAGGSVSYGSIFDKVQTDMEPLSTNKGISVQPFMGKSFSKSSIIGISLYYQGSRSSAQGPPGQQANTFHYGAGVFYRKYAMIGKGFYIFAEGQFQYAFSTSQTKTVLDPFNFQKGKVNNFQVFLYPGVAYALSSKIFIEMSTNNLVNINFFDQKTHIELSQNLQKDEHVQSFNVSSSVNQLFNYSFGFRMLLKKKSK